MAAPQPDPGRIYTVCRLRPAKPGSYNPPL